MLSTTRRNKNGINLGRLDEIPFHQPSLALYDPQKHRSLAFLYGQDLGVHCLTCATWALWYLGYPDQALKKNQEALTLAQELSHPYSLAIALTPAAMVHQFRREGQAAQERANALIALSTEHGFPLFLALGTVLRGWALAEQGQGEEGITQMRQGLTAWQATGAEIFRSHFLALLVEGCGKVGQVEEGLAALAEALDVVNKSGERNYEAELYRLYGELLLRRGEWEKGGQGMGESFPHSPDLPLPPSSPEEGRGTIASGKKPRSIRKKPQRMK